MKKKNEEIEKVSDDEATLVRAFRGYGGTIADGVVRLPKGKTTNGDPAPALVIRLDGDVLHVDLEGGALAPERDWTWALDRIRAERPDLAARIEMARIEAASAHTADDTADDSTETQESAEGAAFEQDDEAMRPVFDDFTRMDASQEGAFHNSEDHYPTLAQAVEVWRSIGSPDHTPCDDSVEHRKRVRAVVKETPAIFYERPVFPALVRIKLSDPGLWSVVDTVLPDRKPTGLRKLVEDKAAALVAARRMGDLSPELSVEIGPDLMGMAAHIRANESLALAPATVDMARSYDDRIIAAMARLVDALTTKQIKQEECDRYMARLEGVRRMLWDEFRQAGVRVGLLRFRVEVARRRNCDGAAVALWLVTDGIFRHHERVSLPYDANHVEEAVDFCGEVLASIRTVYQSNSIIGLTSENEDDLPKRTALADNVVVSTLGRHIDFTPGKDGRSTRGLPLVIGSTLVKGGANVDDPRRHEAAQTMRTPRVLDGITRSPILHDDGSMHCISGGYDRETRMFAVRPPILSVPERPTFEEVERAFLELRRFFDTFLWLDENHPKPDQHGILHNDLSIKAGQGECAVIALLLTMIARGMFDIVPGFLFNGALDSGSGGGKGLLARCCGLIAHGTGTSQISVTSTREDLDKAIVAAVIAGNPFIGIDNFNARAIDSDLISTIITEPGATVRELGASKNVRVGKHVVAINGNGVRVTGDNVNRFIEAMPDPRVVTPATRDFSALGKEKHVEAHDRRAELLGYALTVLRWACQNQHDDVAIPRVSGYRMAKWARLVRDPLAKLGSDILLRQAHAAANDPRRTRNLEILSAWWQAHGDQPVLVRNLAPTVTAFFRDRDGRPLPHNLTGNRVADLSRSRFENWSLHRHDPSSQLDLPFDAPRGAGRDAVYWRLRWTAVREAAPPRRGEARAAVAEPDDRRDVPPASSEADYGM